MKIIGQCVVGPGEARRYLKQTLDEFDRLCDDAIIALCNAGPEEKELVDRYGFWSYEDNREWGTHQPHIKTELLRRIHRLQPDWVLVLDADETVPTVERSDLEAITCHRESCYFYVVNLWNDEEHYSRTLSFWNVRFYKADIDRGIQFLKRPLHCGNAPPYFYSMPSKESYVPHILLHRGLMDPDDRKRKYARYQQYDPKARYKDKSYYDALLLEGPATEYDQQAVLNKIREFCDKL
jgi:hypothetical protein